MPRRKPGSLLPIEISILEVALSLRSEGVLDFHGFSIAHSIQSQTGARSLTAHGTLYRALSRMQRDGLLDSNWEDAAIGEAQGRPRRRLYWVTGQGELAHSAALATASVRPMTTRLALS